MEMAWIVSLNSFKTNRLDKASTLFKKGKRSFNLYKKILMEKASIVVRESIRLPKTANLKKRKLK